MSIPTTEIIIFDTSEEFRNDPSILRPAFDIVSKADGIQMPAYAGVQIENPATGYVFLNWDSQEHHQAMIASPLHDTLREALKPVLGGSEKIYHVIFNKHPTALQQPVTEILCLALKDPSNRAEVLDIFTKNSASPVKINTFGSTLEDENLFILVGGWLSVESHWQMHKGMITSSPELKAQLERLQALTDKKHLFHTALTPYEYKEQLAVNVSLEVASPE
ncbi:hypothetical protein DEU56DRAFT_918561 [Suillus clintonianus]|uniref:uncharacterized protein n=1 Tax=Suillus clintonianus TaxID=1904413 RepID=UPI001B879DB8|nr:uncharacterized protein DEU56DRAFT_918561 [Suillus clintonianus]KAG2119396.1 hypothetical protein DEU56DRAFT_918561 [Suillus clintonianus]